MLIVTTGTLSETVCCHDEGSSPTSFQIMGPILLDQVWNWYLHTANFLDKVIYDRFSPQMYKDIFLSSTINSPHCGKSLEHHLTTITAKSSKLRICLWRNTAVLSARPSSSLSSDCQCLYLSSEKVSENPNKQEFSGVKQNSILLSANGKSYQAHPHPFELAGKIIGRGYKSALC